MCELMVCLCACGMDQDVFPAFALCVIEILREPIVFSFIYATVTM